MRKWGKILVTILMVISMNIMLIHAEDNDQEQQTEDEEYYEEVQSNLPWKQEVKGGVYGYMLGVIKKPDPVQPEEPDQPQQPETPKEDDIIILVPTDPEQENPQTNSGENQATGSADQQPPQPPLFEVGYSWNEQTKQLTIRRALLQEAKWGQHDLYLYVEADQFYRIHIAYEDIESIEEDILIDLSDCQHHSKIQRIAGKEALWILQCEKANVEMKISIGVKVPDSWKDKALYHYRYDNGKFILQKMSLKADEEGYVEVVLLPEADQVITDHPIIQTGLWEWVKGVFGDNDNVDQHYAIPALGCFVIATGGLSYVFLKRKWGKKSKN